MIEFDNPGVQASGSDHRAFLPGAILCDLSVVRDLSVVSIVAIAATRKTWELSDKPASNAYHIR